MRIVNIKDAYTKEHSFRVARYSKLIAKELGLRDSEAQKYYNAALMHDIGKIGIPSRILNEPGDLSEKDFSVIKTHTTKGYEILKGISLMPEAAEAALYHHERMDGSGYPNGLKGDEIPLIARVIAVADSFDAMYSERPYDPKKSFEECLGILRSKSGDKFDPDVVEAFCRAAEKSGLTEGISEQ
ncbi:MAG: HD-GYP domain-containing protein [Clostridia bacterium]|nr:HD-GYP domain-containing protein [Clostridia bacterium]